MVEEFVAIQRELSERAKEAGVPWRSVSRTEVFGDTYRFLIASPVTNLATFDEPGEAGPALSSLISRVQRCITGRQSYAVLALPDISNPLPESDDPDLMIVNMSIVAPGREGDYLNIMKTSVLPHFDEAKVHHVTGSLAFGGEGGFIHVFYVENFAELDKGSPVMRALGAEGAQEVTASFSGIVSRSELWLARILPGASYGQGAEESEEP